MNTIIEIRNATKRFKDKTVFENISLNFEKGKSYGFIGYNGCGKSVFFKTICGFSRLTEGEVICNGKVIGKDMDFIQDAGVVIETPEFINDYSGFKNLKLLAQVQNKIGDKEILETLEMVGLSNDKDKKVRKYSLGMKQKLRLAQAFMEKPKILILDEPMNGLDKKSVLVVRSILNRFVNNGGTLLMTSHNAEDIQTCCEYIYEFDNQMISPKK
ncbi:MAG TPA: ATP-binding cassette domain-containing protein [Candidatus Fimimorpha faecalis]|uniref:ATP-binding cassette domain-containing protein n=1 Tax=Candidatus Fimimorpha faecalis TaxID=2840824 RepID=A0A9D1JD20_9FIRM|nr:ATP-binding cassette domain-containing protein [Candidatus Fimimorpha faecalis]